MEKQVVEVLSPDVGSLIYMVRNKQVMVDSAKRFPEDFCFQLTAEELKILRCQSGTAKLKEAETEDGRGGRRTLPYVFTEQGISIHNGFGF